MKRLLSWLLALVMIISCLPLSALPAFAAETEIETENGDDDFVLDMDNLLPGYTAEYRLTVEWTWNDAMTEGTASVTVPANETFYFEYQGDPAYELTVDGVAHEFVAAAGRTDTNKFEITNDTDAEQTYALKLALPVGTYNNPKVIESMGYYDEVTQTLGDYEGYYYIYTATETGNVTLYINAEYDDNGVIDCGDRDIKVTNLNTYAQYSLLEDGVDNYGLELTVPVVAGEQLLINTSWVEDAEGNPFPAGTYSWTGNFSYPEGTENNPIVIEWEWDENYANATASVTVEADGTYYVGQAGMILTANGDEIAMDEAGNFVLNAGTYELALATPLGAQNNPEVIENIDGYEDTNSLAENESYYYIWTATEDGTVTLDVTDGANLTVDKLTYTEDSEWPISTQYVLAEYAYNDDWTEFLGWTVAENLVIDVVAGEQLKIQVVGYSDVDAWTVPATEYTLTGEFEAAEPEIPVASDLIFYRANTSGGDLMLGDDIRASFMVKPNGYSRVYLEITKDGVTSIVEKNELSSSSMYRYAYVVPAAHMTMDINLTIWGEKDGVTYRGEQLVFSIRGCVEAKLASWINNPAAAGQCKLLMNMLYYGEKAQMQFGVNTDNLATTGLPQEYLDLISTEIPSLKAYPTVDTTGMIAKLNTMGFMLQEKVKLNVIFTLTSAVTNPDEYYVEVKHIPSKEGVASVTYTYTSEDFTLMNNNKAIQFFFDKIAPSQMRDDVEYTVYHNGEAISATYVRGMETVANYYVTNAPALSELVYAIMNYADAAKAVFG